MQKEISALMFIKRSEILLQGLPKAHAFLAEDRQVADTITKKLFDLGAVSINSICRCIRLFLTFVLLNSKYVFATSNTAKPKRVYIFATSYKPLFSFMKQLVITFSKSYLEKPFIILIIYVKQRVSYPLYTHKRFFRLLFSELFYSELNSLKSSS